MPFRIIRNDITKVKADAIVNTANPHPVIGGGTDSAIYQAAGEEKLLKEREKIGEIEPGDAAFTKAYALNVKYIIHTVGPAWDGGEKGEFDILRSCYRKSLNLAKELKCESIAFPLIATGVYGFPRDKALTIATSVIQEFLFENDMDVMLVVFDSKSFVLSGKIFSGVDSFIEENSVSEKLGEEYYVSDRANSVVQGFLNLSHHRRRRMDAASAAYESTPMEDAEADEYDAADPEVTAEMMSPVALASMKPQMSDTLDERVAHISDTWQENLIYWIDKKKLKDPQVYKKANIDRKLFSKIRSKREYQPKKSTAVALALALELDLDEAKDFLGRAGYALSPSSVFDLIIEYFIEQKVYDSYTINLALFEHDQPLLGE